MWSDSRDTSESGEHVLLLQPITGKSSQKKPTPSSSHIGGLPCFYDGDSSPIQPASTICTTCNEQMHLLLQLNAPLDDLDRTLYVFGCNRPTCHTTLVSTETESKFRVRFNGSPIRCFRSQRSQTRSSEPVKAPIDSDPRTKNNKLDNNDWGDDDSWGASSEENDDDWGARSSSKNKSNDVSMDDLEAMVSKCEMQSKQVPSNSQSKSRDKPQAPITSIKSLDNATNGPSFRQYNLEMFDEPPAPRKSGVDDVEDDDNDDDYVDSNNIDSIKVNQMLSRYLEMEDDEEILSALRGDGIINSPGKGGGGGERYERLPPEERAFMAFSKRLKRAPKQVVRYAYGGIPLWSIPHQQAKQSQSEESKGPKSKNKVNNKGNKNNAATVPDVPPCNCGSQRVFEFQLLPSMLHVLDVDSTSANETYDETDLTTIGGMNWGSIAVYSCPESCDKSREEVCIVQIGDEVVKKAEGSAGEEEDDANSMDEIQ